MILCVLKVDGLPIQNNKSSLFPVKLDGLPIQSYKASPIPYQHHCSLSLLSMVLNHSNLTLLSLLVGPRGTG